MIQSVVANNLATRLRNLTHSLLKALASRCSAHYIAQKLLDVQDFEKRLDAATSRHSTSIITSIVPHPFSSLFPSLRAEMAVVTNFESFRGPF
ncbi:unnamed protein product, partial [Mesorhabditis belari]|uniref:Uncharacterized protein n=1 Tax=Mesorhabditis belari TaxID=2138241 RepID=A0AAF3FPS0_9BILA